MAEALPHKNRAVSNLEGGVWLPHSDEQDPFRALQFLIPSRLEGMWGVVDGKAGGLADAHIGIFHVPSQVQPMPMKFMDVKSIPNMIGCIMCLQMINDCVNGWLFIVKVQVTWPNANIFFLGMAVRGFVRRDLC